MSIFTCRGFKGFWPVGTAAVVQAETRETAELLLRRALAQHGLHDAATGDLELVELAENEAVILCNGSY